MIEEILAAAEINHRRARLAKPPSGVYAVYTDDISAGGADDSTCIYTHHATIELYESVPDDDAETSIEEQLNARGIQWDKQDRYWIQQEQVYQVVYEFDFVVKRR